MHSEKKNKNKNKKQWNKKNQSDEVWYSVEYCSTLVLSELCESNMEHIGKKTAHKC